MNNEIAIQTHDLTKIYGSGNTEVVAMRDASVSVRRGEVVALPGDLASACLVTNLCPGCPEDIDETHPRLLNRFD